MWPILAQERALNLLRNQTAHCPPSDVRGVLAWSRGELLPLAVSRVAAPGAAAAQLPPPVAAHRIQALYTLVNVAAAGVDGGLARAHACKAMSSLLSRLSDSLACAHACTQDEQPRLCCPWPTPSHLWFGGHNWLMRCQCFMLPLWTEGSTSC